ncbi:AfsR/SARP family transcriptional regulator [Kitasatospora phosalacinea]|uniref:AfsR/SARP family transcriptional regulator n=1 Tax=Kitasatospora phosalacinea TaxID=2065 RepID=UPI0007C6D53B|nr:BTAD domain-containing putative transcriptional regulator [Kitasatospora phosalacinea]
MIVRFSLLGPLSVRVGDDLLPLGPLKQRLVLAVLLGEANRFVSVDRLTEALWADEPPRTARKNIQVYVSALRRTLEPAGDRIHHGLGGYLIRVAEPELDALRFQALARTARATAANGRFEAAAALFDSARRLWTGPPLPELLCSEPVRAQADQLVGRYLAVSEDWAEAALESGLSGEVAEVTAELLEQHPLRERLRAAHMTALHRCGRRAEALAAYEEVRQRLSRELGLSPSPALTGLYESILADGAPAAGAARPGGAGRRAPHALPPDLPDFTGRRGQVAELVAAASDGGGVVLVTGPAGVGKTALAVHAAHRLAEHFPDGRIHLSLREPDGSRRSPASLAAELARYTGHGARVPEHPDLAAASWRAWLADRRVLLVLDDAPDEASVRPLLPGTGASTAVVTARTRLAGLVGTRRVDLPPYSVEEALELLDRITDRVGCDRAAAERLVRACGLLPLAVRVAGLKLTVLRHLPMAEYAARLADPRTVLDELAVGDLDVRALLADEWRRLDDAHRFVLLRLGRLPDSSLFTAEGAAVALGCAPDAARRQIERLIEAGVVLCPDSEVTAHAAVYALPHLTRLLAREQAAWTVYGEHAGWGTA